MTSIYYDEQQEFIPEHRSGHYGTYPGREERAGFKQKEEYRPVVQQLHTGPSFVSEFSEHSSSCQSCLEGVLRPCFAEFCAVFVTVFLTVHLEHELTERHVLSIHRITLLALLDAMVATIFIAAFKTVHIHPVITLANLLSLSTSWFVCLLIFIMQVFASVLAVAATSAQRGSPPQYAVLNQDINTEWIKAAYRLMFVQFLGTSLVVVTHLMSYQSEGRSSIRIAKLKDNALGTFMAIALSSFLSLLHSTTNWNSLVGTAISLYRAITRNSSQSVLDQYIFWLGPVIGSLLACFLFRLLYAPDERRFIRCCEPKETHIL